MRRLFNNRERIALQRVAGGRCELCGEGLGPSFHADHVLPFARGGATDLANAQALCPTCNLKKGAKPMTSVATQTIPQAPFALRNWQAECLQQQQAALAAGQRDFVVGAGVGSGKTLQALTFAQWGIDAGHFDFVVICVPKTGIRREWTNEATKLGMKLEPAMSSDTIRRATEFGIPDRIDGFVLSYQLLSGLVNEVTLLTQRRRVLVIVDEGHHNGVGMTWGDAVQSAADGAVFRLGLSGTPYRSDDARIPLLHYQDGNGVPHYSYSYGQALGDSVVAPVFFRFIGGTGRFTVPELGAGQTVLSFADGDYGGNEGLMRLRLSLFTEQVEDWQDYLFAQAHAFLEEARRTDRFPWGGLAVFHRRSIARAAAERARRKYGIRVRLVLDDEDTEAAVEAFNAGEEEWVFAISKVSEGINIPRLRVLAYLSKFTARLYFDQTWGRVIRLVEGFDQQAQYAAVFLPADPRLKEHVADIRELVNHHLQQLREEAEAQADQADANEAAAQELRELDDVLAVRELMEDDGANDDGQPEFVVVHEVDPELDGLANIDELFTEDQVAEAQAWFAAQFNGSLRILSVFQQVLLYSKRRQ